MINSSFATVPEVDPCIKPSPQIVECDIPVMGRRSLCGGLVANFKKLSSLLIPVMANLSETVEGQAIHFDTFIVNISTLVRSSNDLGVSSGNLNRPRPRGKWK